MIEYHIFTTPQFEGTKFILWKCQMKNYFSSLGVDVWAVVENGSTISTKSPTTHEEKTTLESNAKAIDAIFNSSPNEIVAKFMHCRNAKEV